MEMVDFVTIKGINVVRVGPGVSPASPWARATPPLGQPKGKKKIYIYTILKKNKIIFIK